MDIRAVLFDIGGVLLRTEDQGPRRKWEVKLTLPPGGLADAVFNSDVAMAASVGNATQVDVWRSVAERFKLDDAALRHLQRDFWAGDRLDEALVEFMRGLRPTYKTGIVSNAWLGVRAFYAQWFGLDDGLVDAMIYSGEVGVAKPDPRIYQIALRQLDVQPQQAVFVDDFVENVKGAEAVGMQVVHFKTPAQGLADVRRILDSH